AFLVGGSVRDLLLARKPKDFDIATDAHPQEIRRLFRNSRIIGRRFRLVQVFFKGGKVVEVSTFRRRSEFEGTDEVLAPNNTFGTPAEDAHRRDLTINGLFYNIADFSIIDYVGGLADLRNRLIRVIGPPEVRFYRDPVRMLRVLRHAARTGFAIDAAAWTAILTQRHLIRLCNPSRVRDELLKDFRSGACAPFLTLMLRSGLLAAILPVLAKTQEEMLLGTRLESRLQEIFGRLDRLIQAGLPCSEAFLWTAFLLPCLELLQDLPLQEMPPETVGPFLEEALQPLAFAPGRREEVLLLWLSAVQILRALASKQRLPARLRRRVCFPEAWLLAHLLTGAPEEFFQEIAARAAITPPAPEPPAPKERRRGRHLRPRKKIPS
ncbi:MAG: poly(A) polymerase, partial [Desulfobacca sp.]|uniref:poly(A) polymerase n=1 Tax=Desulfobacca sp. TaxID=2067990 RepID=UPI0040493255